MLEHGEGWALLSDKGLVKRWWLGLKPSGPGLVATETVVRSWGVVHCTVVSTSVRVRFSVEKL